MPRSWYTATTETDVIALRIAAAELVDVFEDHFDLARGVLRVLALDVLELWGDSAGDFGSPQPSPAVESTPRSARSASS